MLKKKEEGQTKVCRQCKRDLPLWYYTKNPRSLLGVIDQCKECIKKHGYQKLLVNKKCLFCGKVFSGRPNAKYCPPPRECRKLVYVPPKNCPHCGKTITVCPACYPL